MQFANVTTGCPPNTRPAHLAELEACKIYLCSDAMPEYLNVEGDRYSRRIDLCITQL